MKKGKNIFTVAGTVFVLAGILLLIAKGLSPEYIDGNGILHENFLLIPAGFFCIFCGIVSYIAAVVKRLKR